MEADRRTAPTRRERRINGRASRLRSLVASTLTTGLAVLIGVSGAGGTYAWLTASATAPGATVQAGTLTLQINGAASAALGTWEATPNTPQAKAFTITNTGNAPASLTGTIAATTTPALTPYATARLTNVASAAACVPGLGGAQGVLNGYTTTAFDTIAVGATRTYCLEVGLAAGTPVSVSGQSLNFSLTITGTQNGS